MITRFSMAGLTLLAVASSAMAQKDLFPTGQYPQFRTLSGLSGGGFGVRPDGTPSFGGAMAISTPIGYSLSGWHFCVNGSNTSDDLFFKLPHLSGHSGQVDSNGKLSGMVGASLGRYGAITGSVVINSSVGDESYNFQYQAPQFIEKLGLSVGVQDLAGHRGAGSDSQTGGNQNSQSWFTAATYKLPYGIYATLGDGTKRFSKGFGNVSAPFAHRFKAVLEHDGFNFNEAVAYNPGPIRILRIDERVCKTTVMAGFIRSKYAFFSFNLSF